MTQVFQDQTKNEQFGQVTAGKVQEWLVNYLSDLLEIESDKIDVKKPFERYGLDSSAAVFLSGDLGDWLGQELDPTLIYNYSTIASLANHIANGN